MTAPNVLTFDVGTLIDFEPGMLGHAVCWIERRKGIKGCGGTLESAHTVPDYRFSTLADALDAGTIQMKHAA